MNFLYEHENDSSIDNLFLKRILIELNHQHQLCHLCYNLLLIFLLKYILLTFPRHLLHMLFYLKQFYQLILKNNLSNNIADSLYEDNQFLLSMCHYMFLVSRFGDSLLLIRLPSYLIKKIYSM